MRGTIETPLAQRPSIPAEKGKMYKGAETDGSREQRRERPPKCDLREKTENRQDEVEEERGKQFKKAERRKGEKKRRGKSEKLAGKNLQKGEKPQGGGSSRNWRSKESQRRAKVLLPGRKWVWVENVSL